MSGDVVVISAGDYTGDVATWPQNNLTICGAGGRARLFANGQNAAGKGIWVIDGTNVVIDSVEFHDATVSPDDGSNGAGIRAEGNGLTLINTGFYDNQNGVLGPDGGDLTITRSEFARNGVSDPSLTDGYGFTHNIYVGHANKVTVTASFFHEAHIGHNFKSRAKETHIEDSYFMDGPNGTASYQIDVPNGGLVYLRGNLIQKGPQADNSNGISYGEEGLTPSITHTLTLIQNTVTSTDSGGTFLNISSGITSVTLTANLFAGTGGTGKYTGVAASKVSETSSVTTTASNLVAPDNIASPSFWPISAPTGFVISSVPDPTYVQDAPQPFALRTIATSPNRRAGALQAAP